jgi:hypothetical protein
MQRAIAPQQTGVRKPSGAHQHRYQESGESESRVDVIWRFPADRHVLANRLHKANLAKKGEENRDPAEGGHGALRLAQDQPLIRQQGSDLARDWFVRRV